MNDFASLVQYSIAVPLVLAFITLWARIGKTRGPNRRGNGIRDSSDPGSVRLMLHNPAEPGGYAFVSDLDTGLSLIGISLPLVKRRQPTFVCHGGRGRVGGRIGAAQSKADNLHRYLFCLLVMAGLIECSLQ